MAWGRVVDNIGGNWEKRQNKNKHFLTLLGCVGLRQPREKIREKQH